MGDAARQQGRRLNDKKTNNEEGLLASLCPDRSSPHRLAAEDAALSRR